MPQTGVIPTLEGPWKRQARGTARELALTETTLSTELRRIMRAATDGLILSASNLPADRRQARRRVEDLTLVAERSLASGLEGALIAGQQSARLLAGERQGMALDAIAAELGVMIARPTPSLGKPDANRARDMATAAARRWAGNMKGRLIAWERREKGSLADDILEGHRRSLPAGAAATAVHVAYSEEHDHGADEIAEENKGASWLPFVIRRWDATRDKKLCPRCADMNGRYRLLGLDWPQGEVPGQLHRYCRCYEGLMVLPVPLRLPETAEHLANNPRPEQRAA